MIDQADVPAATSVTIATAGRVLSGEVRASLQAVREAQELARLQARRQTKLARLWFAAAVGVVVAGAFTVGPRLARWRRAPAPTRAAATVSSPTVATPAAVAPTTAPPAAAAPTAAPPEPAAPTLAPPAPAAPTLAPPAAATTVAHAAAPSVEAEGRERERRADCDPGFIRKAPWLLSPEACARAFAADSSNASLALAIAHAEHVRGRLAEGATWAKRALALDPKAAEAYVLIARAEMGDGHAEEARAAYRRYLDVAPHGWHRTEARTGVRRTGAKPAHDSSR